MSIPNSKALAALTLASSVLGACIAPPPKCSCEDGSSTSSSSSSSSSGKTSIEAQVAELDLQPAEVLAPLVWDGQSISIINVDPPGSWFAFNDGSPGGEMFPSGTSDFEQYLEDGAIHTKGSGFKEWGGGIGMNFAGGAMVTPADGSKYKGLSFKASGTGWVHVALATVVTMPEFGICTTCYDHYAVDVKLTEEPKVYNFTWDQLKQANWGSPKAKLDPKTLVGFNFTSKGAVPWDFKIDDIQFIE